ncbi:hypothetical protein ACFQ5C_26305, partial [Methylobacterium goesingense]
LALGAGLTALASALLAGVMWCFGVALFCRRLGLLLGRAIWRRPPPRMRLEPSGDDGCVRAG